MRLLSRVALLGALVAIAAPAANAQVSVSLAAGATVPTGDASDAHDMGYHAALGLGFKPLISPIGIRIEGMFNSLEYKSGVPVFGGESLRVLALTANGQYTLMPALYLIGGVGMYNSKVSVDGAESSSDFGFNVGAGINIPLTGFGTYLEARYHHIPTEGDGSFRMIPISFGIRF